VGMPRDCHENGDDKHSVPSLFIYIITNIFGAQRVLLLNLYKFATKGSCKSKVVEVISGIEKHNLGFESGH